MTGSKPILVNKRTLEQGLVFLAQRDSDLASVMEAHGPPPIWGRPAGFATLVRIILEQQVSLASAKAAFDRLKEHLGAVEPELLLTLDDATLKQIGFSRQKVPCCAQRVSFGRWIGIKESSESVGGRPGARPGAAAAACLLS